MISFRRATRLGPSPPRPPPYDGGGELTQATGIILPDRGLELEMRRGREGLRPVLRAVGAGRVPQLRQALRVVEELLEHVQPVGPRDRVRMHDDREMAAALVLRIELSLPIAVERVGILEAGALAREQQEELVVEVIVVGQGEDGAAAREVAHPV